MKSVHSEAPPASRPVPEVCGKVLGNGQAVLDGSGSGAGAWLAAAGTSVGIPLGTPACATGTPMARHAPADKIAHQPLPRIGSLIARGTYTRAGGWGAGS